MSLTPQPTLEQRNVQLIEKMVHGYANQNLELIMPLFSDDAVYQDMRGGGVFGKTLVGPTAIRKHFSAYFRYLMPAHTYRDVDIFAEGNRVFAAWTMVLGDNLPPSQQFHIRGCDYFIIENGKVKEKCAFLKLNLGIYLVIVKMRLREIVRSAISPQTQVSQES